MLPELNTERLLLRQVKDEDQAFIFQGLSHPDVIPFYGVRYNSLEATKAQMEWYAKSIDNDAGGPWKIIHRESGMAMGVIAYYHHNKEHRKAEVGFWLLPQYWHQGYAAEALQEVLRYCQEEKTIHRLEAFVEEGNRASSQLLQKCNFKYEGTMRDCEIKNGKFISLQIYALIFD